MEKHIYSITELTRRIRESLEANFAGLLVEGEVSNLRIPSSGHLYFTLKDAESQLKCVMFRHLNQFLKFELKDGLQVLARGQITVYEKRGDYQLLVEKLEPRGQGALQLAFEQLKEKLEKEGLFLKEHKKVIPLLPMQIGIVTSPTGAAIRDILNVISRRFCRVNIIINPVRVQGEGAADEIVRAIDEFDKMGNLDVLIVTRGGGSIEDLWAFNEEAIARSIFHCRIPVISAVGHEIDYTISDFVADLRAPTPSAAAELVIAEGEELLRSISSARDRITLAIETRLSRLSDRVQTLQEAYGFRRFEDRLGQHAQEIDDSRETIGKRMSHLIELSQRNVENMTGRLANLNPESVLRRGYSLAFKLPEKKLIRDVSVINTGDKVEIKVEQGSFISRVEEKTER
jgi:exodeoxyribonuclease VII large subunit